MIRAKINGISYLLPESFPENPSIRIDGVEYLGSEERNLANVKIRALLVRALVTDSDHEAAAALDAARRLRRKAA